MGKSITPWGRKCKAQMAMMGKTLADLSQETNLSVTYISSIMNGRIVVPDKTVQLISNALEVDVTAAQ